MIALEQALAGRVDRSSYAAEAGVSDPTASGDLRRLVDAGWLQQVGAGRSTGYVPSPTLEGVLRSGSGSD